MTGSAIKSLRQRLGLTQAAFGALYGLGPPSVISQWEIGRREPAGASMTLLRLIEHNPQAMAEMVGRMLSLTTGALGRRL